MPYELLIHREARKALLGLPWEAYQRVYQALEQMARQPRSPQTVKLKGRADLWRLRVGRYRVIYHIDDQRQTLTVLRITVRAVKNVPRPMTRQAGTDALPVRGELVEG